MILTQTEDFTFHLGGKREVLIKNNRKNRYEVWVEAPPGEGNLIWCRWKRPFWYNFGRVAAKKETIQGGMIHLTDDGGFNVEL